MLPSSRTIFTADNLPILRALPDESIDLVYLDPPFNSNRNYEAPIGSKAAGAAFKDTWTLEDTDEAWWGMIAEARPDLYTLLDACFRIGGKANMAYLIYMCMRLIELHRILKPTGSLYLHCDPTMSHSLKLLLDCIFGKDNYRSEIVWKRATSKQKGSQHKEAKLGHQRRYHILLHENQTSLCKSISGTHRGGENNKVSLLRR